MNRIEVTQEQISALTDGELDDPQIDAALAVLRQPERKGDWTIYHQIGDVLRSDDMAVRMSADFSARLAARLELEPPIIAPAIAADTSTSGISDSSGNKQGLRPANAARHPVKRWALSGAAAAAVATAAFLAAPQLMVALKNTPSASPGENITVVATDSAAGTTTTTSPKSGMLAANAPAGVVMRDSRIDDYLTAHQRFAPSVYSTAQYGRPATFPTESSK